MSRGTLHERLPAFQFVRQLGMDLAAGEFDLPPFPDTPLRVQQTMNDPNATLADLAPIVASEPALAARLMRMANSAMMRRGPMEVTDITTAISRLGMDMVLNAAVDFCLPGSIQGAPPTARAAAKTAEAAPPQRQGGGTELRPGAQHALLRQARRGHARRPPARRRQVLYLHARGGPSASCSRTSTGAGWPHVPVAHGRRAGHRRILGLPRLDRPRRGRAGAQGARPHRLADASDVLFVANILARTGRKAAGELDGQEAGQEAQQDQGPPFHRERRGAKQRRCLGNHRGNEADRDAEGNAGPGARVAERVEGETEERYTERADTR
jgi:hypothetical protein